MYKVLVSFNSLGINIDPILNIIPALIGYSISLLVLWYFLSKKHSWGIVISSFLFIISGFLFQIFFSSTLLYSSMEFIKNSQIFTVFVTATGIFLGNTLLRIITDGKERREIAILFVNTINSHIADLKELDSYLNIGINDDRSRITLDQLTNDPYYEMAFKKIGIYNERKIDLISQYSIYRRKCLNNINRYILKNDHSLSSEYKLTLVTTLIFASLCILEFSDEYFKNQSEKAHKTFISDCQRALRYSLFSLNVYADDNIISWIACKDFIDSTKYVQDRYSRYSKLSFDFSLKSPIYLCIILLDSKIIHQITNINTAMKYRPDNSCLISIEYSEEDAKTECRKRLKQYLKNKRLKNMKKIFPSINDTSINDQEFCQLIEALETKVEIISPWK